jgi:hypothetical protein
MTKVGDTVVLENGEEGVVVHVTPAIKEDCDHDRIDGEDGNPERCAKCGLSFTRYIFCCCQ